MPISLKELSELDRFLVRELPSHRRDIAKIVAERFGITRQAVGRHLRRLVAAGVLTATGETRAREYDFAVLGETNVRLAITPALQEDDVWRQHIAPLLYGVPENVIDICRYGVTEIVNNAIDHSASPDVQLVATYTAQRIRVVISDEGIGIFRKIKEACGLEDERQAILELAKGKLTTDPERHTGEGIFFTSRMFDVFVILSGYVGVVSSRRGGDWLFEDRSEPVNGTSVVMEIDPVSSHTTRDVFARYASEQDDYGFNRTHVVAALAEQAHGDKLVSRSQAKRVMARLDRFEEVVLDFKGLDDIGPAFADEIFRVFHAQHPATRIEPVNMNDAVARMVRRATAARDTRDTNPSGEERR